MQENPQFVDYQVTAQEAQAMFALYPSITDLIDLHNVHGYPVQKIEQVDAEVKRIKEELSAYKSGAKVISEAVPAVLDEEGNVLTPEVPAVYYQYTTDQDLLAQVSSELLVVADVYATM